MSSGPAGTSEESNVLWYRFRIAQDLDQGMEAVHLGTRLTAREPGNPATWLLLASVWLFPAQRPDWASRQLKTA